MRKSSLVFSFAILLFLSFQRTVLANESPRGLSISPMFQEITVDSNNKEERIKTFPVDVFNGTESVMTLRLTLFDFGSLDESGGVAFLGAEENIEKKYSLASWMSLDRDALVLDPGETQQVMVSIENRESLSPGGHYGAIVFKTEKNSNDDGGSSDNDANIAVNQSFASLVFVKKMNGAIYDIDLKDYEIRKNWFWFPEIVRMRFQNKGNTHIVPRGLATITDPSNRLVEKGIINPESAIILPEIFRTYPTEMKSVAKIFLPGWYTLAIEYRYDGKDEFSYRNERFFYVPPITIFAGLIAGVAITFFVRKKRKK